MRHVIRPVPRLLTLTFENGVRRRSCDCIRPASNPSRRATRYSGWNSSFDCLADYLATVDERRKKKPTHDRGIALRLVPHPRLEDSAPPLRGDMPLGSGKKS